MFELGQLVTNNRAKEWGVGKIIEISIDYLTAYFPDIDDNKEFSREEHPLKIVSDQPCNIDNLLLQNNNLHARQALQSTVAGLNVTKAMLKKLKNLL